MMKKIIFILFFFFVFSIGIASAADITLLRQETYQDEDEITRTTDFGYTFGFKFSLLGAEPEAGFLFRNLEVLISTPLSRGETSEGTNTFGIGIGGSVSYIDDPFEKGYQNAIGVSGLYLPSLYMRANALLKNSAFNVFALFINYRGTVKFGYHWGMQFRIALPIVLAGDDTTFTIIDSNGAGAICWLMSLATFGIGFRWEFGI